MIKINALGDTCPVPLIKAKVALKAIETDGLVLISVDNEMSKENLEKMAKELGYPCFAAKINDDVYEVQILKGKATCESVAMGSLGLSPSLKDVVVIIPSDKMGSGEEELGKTLLKTFIYTLTECEDKPRHIFFYNSGVKLVAEGSRVIEDLISLSKDGVNIGACGVCLDYYGLNSKVLVGEITNMYNIIDKQMKAQKVITTG